MNENPKTTVTVAGDEVTIERLTTDDEAVRSLVQTRPDDPAAAVVEALATGARQLLVRTSNADVAALEDRIAKLHAQLNELGAGWTGSLEQRLDQLAVRLRDEVAARQAHAVASLDAELERRLDPEQTAWVRRTLDHLSGELQQQLNRHLTTLGSGLAAQVGLSGPDSPLATIGRQLGELHTAVAALTADRAADEARADEIARGTHKGLAFEERCHAAVGALLPDGTLDDVSREPGVDGAKTGDLLWRLSDVAGRQLRVVLEAKDVSKAHSSTTARRLLDQAISNRAAHAGVLLVPDASSIPGRQPIAFLPGDHPALIVAVDGDDLPLRLALRYLQAAVLDQAARTSDGDGLDLARLQELLGRARSELDKFSRVRGELTKAANATQSARDLTDELHDAIDRLIGDALTELTPDRDQLAA